jgi:hypothetical protein
VLRLKGHFIGDAVDRKDNMSLSCSLDSSQAEGPPGGKALSKDAKDLKDARHPPLLDDDA